MLTRRSAVKLLGMVVATQRPTRLIAQDISTLNEKPVKYVFNLDRIEAIQLEYKGKIVSVETSELFEALGKSQ